MNIAARIKKIPRDFIGILFVTVFLFLFRLGATTLTNWDEAWFASVARSMIIQRDFLNGQWNGSTWFYEPPLVTWILSIAMYVYNSSFSLRLLSAISGIITVAVTYLLTRELTKNLYAPLLSSLIVLSDIEFLFRGRTINSDMPLTAFLMITLYAFTKAISTKRPKWLLGAGAAFGLAFLTKRASPLLALPTLSILLFVFRNQVTAIKRWWLVLLAFCLVVVPWHAANLITWGTVFVQQYIVSFTVQRIAVANPTTGTSYFFYFEALKHAFKFWTPIISAGFIWSIFKSRHNKKFLAIAVFIITFLLVMTISAKKASWYILPIHPLLAIAGGIFFSHAFLKFRSKQSAFFISIMILGVFVFQLYHWRAEYIVPDTTAHQAELSLYVKNMTKPDDTIYLDDDYLPVAVFTVKEKLFLCDSTVWGKQIKADWKFLLRVSF